MTDCSSGTSLSVQENAIVDNDRIKKYESLLLNAICVGQWEIARALIRSLFEEKVTRDETGELLKVLILEATEFWRESPSTPSPHHLQWLCLQEYNSLYRELKGELPDYLQDAIEFRLLLYTARELEFYNAEVASFLCLYHDHHIARIPLTKSTTPGTIFSNPCLQFLRNCLYEDPTLGHAIISKLMCKINNELLANNQILQGLFLKCIEGSLNTLVSSIEGVQPDFFESEDQAKFQQYQDLIYDLLSLMDPTPEMTELKLDRVFLRLLELTVNTGLNQPISLFDSKKIYSCLLGRKINYLIVEFQRVEEYVRKSQAKQLQLKLLSDGEENHSGFAFRRVADKEKWRFLFFETLYNNQHMLEHVLCEGLRLISMGELGQLADLISAPEYAPMRSLLLLLGWDRYPHSGSGQELLDTLWAPEVNTQPLLHAACYKLSYQVALVQWCLDKARPFLQQRSDWSTMPYQNKATEMFDGLETHSVLYVLHHSTPLACLNPTEVIEILRMRPHVPTASGGTTPPYPFSGSATPTKYAVATPITESSKVRISTPSPTLLTSGSIFHYPRKLKPEQERDIAIYRAFCAIKLVVDALYLCANHNSTQIGEEKFSTTELGDQKKSVSTRRRLISDPKDEPVIITTSLHLPLLKDEPDESMELGITQRLHKAAEFVSLIQPLNFRLEILENIFSLLFLKYEDIVECKKLSAFDTSLLTTDDVKETETGSNLQTEQALKRLQKLGQETPSAFATGFIVNEQFANELLTILQDCLLDLTSAKYAMRRQSSASGLQVSEQASDMEMMLDSAHMNCAISQSSFHQHITRLKHYINEAKWRLQLVASKMIPKQERLSEDDSDNETPEHHINNITSPEVEEEEVIQLEKSSNKKRRLFSKCEEPSAVDELFVPQLQRSESSLSYSSSKPDDVCSLLQHVKEDSGEDADNEGLKESLKAKEKPTKHARSFSSSSRLKAEKAGRPLSSLRLQALAQSQNIISAMLASPESLLNMCLQRDNYDKAKEILKMFNMEGKVGESLVHFTEAYISLRQEFQRYSRFSTPKSSPQVFSHLDSRSSGERTPDSVGSANTPTVESLKLLGTAKKETPNIALQTALLTCITLASPLDSVHKLLASPFINKMLFAGDAELEKHATAMPVLRNLMDHTPTLILLDILCTNHMSGEVARQIVAMATQRSGQFLATPTSWDTGNSTETMADLSTPLSLLKVFVELSAFYSAFPTSVKEMKSKQDSTTTLIRNYACPCDFINGYHYKFHGNTIMQYRQFMEDLYEQFGELEIMIEQVFSEKLDVLEYIKNAKPTKSSSVSEQHRAIRTLIVSLDKGWSSVDETSMADTTEPAPPRVNYLQALYAHLCNITSMLHTLFSVHEGGKVSGVQVIPHPLVMLGESPTHLLGRLIFERKFPPEMLDSFAYNLRMNLVEVIVKGCCPAIDSRPVLDARSATPIVTGPAGSLKSSAFPIVLNKQESSSRHLDTSDICLLSYNLLTKMLSIVKEIPKSTDGCVGLKELSYVVHNSDVANIMADTSVLAEVDLRLLDTDYKKTVFFANVTNLLYCHTMLLYGLCQADSPLLQLMPDLIPLLCTVDDGSWLSYLTLFSCVGYRVGQLGIISCIDLHYCILFHEFPHAPKLPYHFSYALTEDDPWLEFCCSVPPDPRILFVIGNIWNTSPFPRPLHAEDSGLELAELDYLDKAVVIDPESNQVTISSFLNDFFNKFIKTSDSKQPESSDTALLKYLALKLSSQHAPVLKQMMEDSAGAKPRKGTITVKVVNTDKNLYRFAYTVSSFIGTPSPRSQPNSPSLSRYMSQVSADTTDQELHSLNTKTLLYIQQRFGLVASLLQLLCQVESSDSKPPEETVEETKPTKAPSLFKTLKGQTPTKEPKGKPLTEPVLKKGKKWCDLYTELLDCYDQYTPLKSYIESRVSPFEDILSFRSAKNKVGENKRRHPSIADVGLASARSNVLYSATSYGLQNHTRNRRFQRALEMLSSEPLANCIEDSFLVSLKQTILRITYLSLLKKENAPNPESLLARLDDPELCARLALQSVKHWPITTCIDVLSMCSGRLHMNSTLLNVVNKQLKKMKNYSEIMQLCNQKDSDELVKGESVIPSSSVRWLSWTQLANDSVSNPSSVLRQLIRLKQYDLARQWAIMDGIPRQLTEEIEVQYLLDIFTESNNRKARAQQVLDGLCSDADSRLSVCKELLNNSQIDFNSRLFILHYIILNLSSLFDQETMVEYANRALGIKALLCLPESASLEYSSLVSEPFTLVEQLMMNMKLEWAATVISCLREDELFSYMNCSNGPGVAHLKEKPFTTDSIDQLLTYYALKALEFPPPVILTPQDAFVDQSMVVSRQMTPTPSRVPSPRTQRLSVNEQKTVTDPSNAQILSERQEASYKPPPVPPPSHKWETDSQVTKCRVCKGLFGLFNRRHHCRRCGRVVCGVCSAQQMPVNGYERPQRACNDCYNHHFPPKQSSEDSSEEDTVDQNTTTLPQAPVIPPDLSAPYGLNRYRLKSGDHLTNMALRSDFNYSGSPDCPLCISLMELHSDRKQCAEFILDCASSVSLQLMPNDSGQLNEEIDKQFVIGIIRYLLLSAKVKFSTAGCHDSVELCDTYLSRVDLLKMFVSSNYKRIPSIQELTQQDSSRRIRDQLLQDDRFSLAMEISTKCNLDTLSVWASWGMAWLKVGDFEKAREKLKLCFLPPLQAIGSSSHNASLLSRVIEAIESAPLAAIHNPQDEWSTVINTATMLLEKQSDCFLDKYRYDECMYYLKKYGSQSSKIAFLFKHGFVQKACKYILEQKCSTELFLEALLIPALKRGQFDVVKHEMKTCDQTLKQWEPYLVASCRYFNKRQLFAILYEIQIFMKDFIRAGMTCIKFYTGFSGKQINITDLYNRITYLYKAEEHLNTYLDTKSRPSTDIRVQLTARLTTTSHEEGVAVMSMSTEETHRHINSIKLQVEVTEYLYKCYSKKGILGGSVPMVMVQKVQQPATLFGGAPVRSQVACQVLLLSSTIENGFPLVLKILKTFYLPRGKFFSQAAHMLATAGRCADIHRLLECVKTNDENYVVYTDEIILAAVKELAKTPNNEPKEIDKLVNLLNSDISKINAFIQCGKLKSAYLAAIKGRYVDEVRRISTIATQAGQTAIRDICDRWLQMNASTRT